ncbi:MAG: SPOR domain-containing protein [Beijerinckiaceae bacterium]|nr:SPOR domain-containing protein [Beijerinckiaceae bacterium]
MGSAGKLTYSRRGGDAWRLRVTNLDQATAEAVCAKLKGAGAPCTVGPN